MNCQYCNNQLPPNAKHCPSCGAPAENNVAQAQQQAQTQYGNPGLMQNAPMVCVASKSPFLAELLSCLITGLGQLYNGQIAKGIVLFFADVILSSFTLGIAHIVFWIINIIDAGAIAKKLNAGKVVGEWEFF